MIGRNWISWSELLQDRTVASISFAKDLSQIILSSLLVYHWWIPRNSISRWRNSLTDDRFNYDSRHRSSQAFYSFQKLIGLFNLFARSPSCEFLVVRLIHCKNVNTTEEIAKRAWRAALIVSQTSHYLRQVDDLVEYSDYYNLYTISVYEYKW